MKRFILILILLVLLLTPIVIFAEETERERLVRIETKLDILIEQNRNLDTQYKALDSKVNTIEKTVDKHSTWWSQAWSILGVLATAIIGLVAKSFWGVIVKQEVKG